MKYSMQAKPYKNIYDHISRGNYGISLKEIKAIKIEHDKKELYSRLEQKLMADMWDMPSKKIRSAYALLDYIRAEIIKYNTIQNNNKDIEKRSE